MKRLSISAAILALTINHGLASDTWITKDSKSTVPVTVDRLVSAIETAGGKVFATVDHAANAKKAESSLAPTVLVIFGNPKIGTPIIQSDRRAGLDLPAGILIWEEGGVTRIGYEDPQSLKAKYGIKGADQSFDAMSGALNKLTEAASR